MRLSIFWKILAMLGGTIVIVSAAIFLTTNHFVTASLDEQALDRLENYRQATDMEINAIQSNIALINEIISRDQDVADAIITGNSKSLQEYGQELLDSDHIEFVSFVDAEGEVLARGHRDESGDNISDQYSVEEALQGNSIVGVEQGEHLSLSIRSGSPVRMYGNVIGAIVMGVNFETHAFVDRIGEKLGVDATIFEEDTRLSTTIRDDGQRVVGTSMGNPDVTETVLLGGGEFVDQSPILGIMYDTIYWPIIDMRGETVGMYFLGVPREVIEGIQANVLNSILAATAIIGALMLAGGAYFARTLSRPISQATNFALGVAKGNLSDNLSMKRRDEIGSLTQALTQIQDSIKNIISDIKNTSSDIQKGHIRSTVPPDRYPGDFANLVGDINNASETVAEYLENLPVATMIVDKDCTILWMNKKGLESSQTNPVNKKCHQIFDMQGCGSETCATKKCMQTGNPEYSESELTIDGQPYYLAYYSSPIKGSGGKVFGAFEVQVDLTENKKAQRRIEQTAQSATHIAERLSSASEELSSQVEQSSRGAEEQKNRTGEAATSMEEMNATVLEVAKNASGAAEQTDEAKDKAQEGARIVRQSVESINKVQEQTREMKESLNALGKQSEEIGKVMNVIDDIADQTNLLALNAAIEAARAGDAGRGFAVVADEVRKLAEKTMNATKEVEKTVTSIQESTNSNVQNMDRAARMVEEATDLANKSGQALQEIVDLAQQAADQVRSIATASEEQSSASEEVNKSMDEINRIAEETADVMQQSAKAIGELAQQAGELQNIIDELKKNG